MKRRNDLYITEYMLQASLQDRHKNSNVWKYVVGFGAVLVFVAALIFAKSVRIF